MLKNRRYIFVFCSRFPRYCNLVLLVGDFFLTLLFPHCAIVLKVLFLCYGSREIAET